MLVEAKMLVSCAQLCLVMVTCLKDFFKAKKLPHYCVPDLRVGKNLFQKALPGSGHSGLLRHLLCFFFGPEHDIIRKHGQQEKMTEKICQHQPPGSAS